MRKNQSTEATMKTLPYGAKLEAIKKAMKKGQKFYLHTYLGKKEVLGIDFNGSWAVSGTGLQQRSWAICSTQVDRWYGEIGKQGTTITPQQWQQLKNQLAERTTVRRRKEDARRQHIYK